MPEIYAYGLRNPYRFAFDTLTGDLILADVGQNNIEEINQDCARRQLRLGGEGRHLPVQPHDRSWRKRRHRRRRQPGSAGQSDRPDLRARWARSQYDHGDGISITGGFVYRGSAIPELFGKYVFGDLAIRNAPPRVDGRLFYADLTTGQIHEFLIPQFANDQLPNQVTVHGFRPGWARRAVRAGDQHAGQRHRRHRLQVCGGAGAGDVCAARRGLRRHAAGSQASEVVAETSALAHQTISLSGRSPRLIVFISRLQNFARSDTASTTPKRRGARSPNTSKMAAAGSGTVVEPV